MPEHLRGFTARRLLRSSSNCETQCLGQTWFLGQTLVRVQHFSRIRSVFSEQMRAKQLDTPTKQQTQYPPLRGRDSRACSITLEAEAEAK